MCKLVKGPCNATVINPIKVIKDPLGKEMHGTRTVPDNFTLIR